MRLLLRLQALQARATLAALRREPALCIALGLGAILATAGLARLAAAPPVGLRVDILTVAAAAALLHIAVGWAKAEARRTAEGPLRILVPDAGRERMWASLLALTVAAPPLALPVAATLSLHPAAGAKLGFMLLLGAALGSATGVVAARTCARPALATGHARARAATPIRRRGLEAVFLQITWSDGRPTRAAWLAGSFALAAAAGGLALHNNDSAAAGAIVAGGGCALLGAGLGAPDPAVMRLLGPTPAGLGRLWRIAVLPGAAATLTGTGAACLLAGTGVAIALPAAAAAGGAVLVAASLVALHGLFRTERLAGVATAADLGAAGLLAATVGPAALAWAAVRGVLLVRAARRRRWSDA